MTSALYLLPATPRPGQWQAVAATGRRRACCAQCYGPGLREFHWQQSERFSGLGLLVWRSIQPPIDPAASHCCGGLFAACRLPPYAGLGFKVSLGLAVPNGAPHSTRSRRRLRDPKRDPRALRQPLPPTMVVNAAGTPTLPHSLPRPGAPSHICTRSGHVARSPISPPPSLATNHWRRFLSIKMRAHVCTVVSKFRDLSKVPTAVCCYREKYATCAHRIRVSSASLARVSCGVRRR